MKASFINTLPLTVLLVYFGNVNAQSDLLAFTEVNSASIPVEIAAKFNAEEKIKISDFIPNPASNVSTVTVNCVNPVSMKVKFFSMSGDLAKEELLNLVSGVNELKVDMNGLAKGIYMVQLYSKDGSAVRRVMKMN